jgi:hypothetical protein
VPGRMGATPLRLQVFDPPFQQPHVFVDVSI